MDTIQEKSEEEDVKSALPWCHNQQPNKAIKQGLAFDNDCTKCDILK